MTLPALKLPILPRIWRIALIEVTPESVTRRDSTGTDLRLLLTGPEGMQIDVDLPRRGAPALAVGDHFRLRPLWGAMFSGGAPPTVAAPADPIRLSA